MPKFISNNRMFSKFLKNHKIALKRNKFLLFYNRYKLHVRILYFCTFGKFFLYILYISYIFISWVWRAYEGQQVTMHTNGELRQRQHTRSCYHEGGRAIADEIMTQGDPTTDSAHTHMAARHLSLLT